MISSELKFKVFLYKLGRSKAAMGFLLLAIVVSSFIITQPRVAHGSSYTMVQSSWSGGLDGGTYPSHPGNQSGYSKYDSKDAGIVASSDVRLGQTSSSITQTSADFSSGTATNVQVNGSNLNLSTSGITYPWNSLTTPPRVIASASAWDTQDGKMYVFGGNNSAGTATADVYSYDPSTNAWIDIPSATNTNPPNLANGTAVWSPANNKFYIYSLNGTSMLLYSYTPSTNTWVSITATGTIPPARANQSAVWDSTNNKMYVFGGYNNGFVVNDLYSYTPSTNTWANLAPTGTAPTARYQHSAVWDSTNNKMYVFGGYSGSYLNDLYSYTPSTNTWATLSPTGTTPPARVNQSAVWDSTNNKMYVFGGYNGSVNLNDLYSYTPSTNTWATLSPTGTIPAIRSAHTGVWNPVNSTMYIFGGSNNSTYYNDLDSYTPSSNTWATLKADTLPTPTPRRGSSAVWSPADSKIYLFGGYGASILNDLYSYTPSNKTWATLTPTGTAPSARYFHTAVWDSTNNKMYVFGGYNGSAYLNDLYSYTPSTNTWATLTPTGTAPSARYAHTAVWDSTNNKMYVFGGNGGSYLNDFYSYTPSTNTWATLTPTGTAPSVRYFHTAVWDSTNSKMYVFGGDNGTVYFNDFYSYTPSTNTWATLTPTGTAPSARRNQIAVWDSTAGIMYIFGGYNGTAKNDFYSYTLSTNSWSTLTSSGNVPAIRMYSSGVWDQSTNKLYITMGYSGSSSVYSDLFSLSPINAYLSSGDLISSIVDMGQKSTVGSLTWTNTLPTNTTVKFQIRSATTSAGLATATWYGPTSSSDYYTSSGTPFNSVHNGDRYIQFRAYLSTTDNSVTPSLTNVTLGFSYYPALATLTSSAYNTGDPTNVFARLAWTQTVSSATSIKFQVRTAPNSGGSPGTWSAWCGPDNAALGCDSTTYFTDSTGGQNVDADFKDGVNDQWIQYKTFLATTDGTQTPILSSVTSTYVVNGAPVVANATASQAANGVVSVGYDVSDVDNTTETIGIGVDVGITLSGAINNSVTSLVLSNASVLPASGSIFIDNEEIAYTSKSANTLNLLTRGMNNSIISAHNDASIVYVKAATVAGNVGSGVAVGTAKAATWNAATDMVGVTTTTAKIKVFANDGNAANQVASSVTANFALDTTPPTTLKASSVRGVPTDYNAGTVTWTTDKASDSTVDYGLTSAYGLTISAAGLVTNHSVNLVSLAPSTTYHFRIRSVDGNNNSLVDDNLGASYTFTTTAAPSSSPPPAVDVTPPLLSSMTIGTITSNSATINWNTDEPANSFVYYSVDSSFSSLAGSPDVFALNHQVIIGGLTPTTTYNYKIVSLDKAGNKASSAVLTFATIAAPPTGTTPSVTDQITALQAKISDLTAQKSALDTQITAEIAVIAALPAGDPTLATEQAKLAALQTQSDAIAAQLAQAQSDLTALQLNAPGASQAQVDALLALQAKQAADLAAAQAALAKAPTQAVADALKAQITAIQAQLADTSSKLDAALASLKELDAIKKHATEVETLNNKLQDQLAYITNKILGIASGDKLSPAELLKIVAQKFSDIIRSIKGSTTVQEKQSIETSLTDANTTLKDLSNLVPAPRIITTPAVQVGATEAIIAWTTDKLTSGVVHFTEESSYKAAQVYGSSSNDQGDLSNKHVITLTGLTPNTIYHYEISSTSAAGAETTSADFTFKTKTEVAVISSAKISKVSDTSVTITWNTSIPTSAVVAYTPVVNGTRDTKNAKSEGNPELSKDHSITLKDLAQGTTYVIEITSSDVFGSIATEKLGNIVTSFDKIPPVIDQVHPEVSIIPSEKVGRIQTIVTWKTNKPATTQVLFASGSNPDGKLNNSTDLNPEYTFSHTAIVNDWVPGTTYTFRVVSKDQSGNVGQSKAYTLKTPEQKATVVDVIVNNFTDVFGWTNRINK